MVRNVSGREQLVFRIAVLSMRTKHNATTIQHVISVSRVVEVANKIVHRCVRKLVDKLLIANTTPRPVYVQEIAPRLILLRLPIATLIQIVFGM